VRDDRETRERALAGDAGDAIARHINDEVDILAARVSRSRALRECRFERVEPMLFLSDKFVQPRGMAEDAKVFSEKVRETSSRSFALFRKEADSAKSRSPTRADAKNANRSGNRNAGFLSFGD
jgi:hypothetical protein